MTISKIAITFFVFTFLFASAPSALAAPFDIKRVSVDDLGNGGDDLSATPSISANGRYVAFSSNASNLVPNDTNGAGDIFVYDRNLNTTERVSVTNAGDEANGSSFYSTTPISSDGRFVAFASFASNLVEGDTNGILDVFVRDLETNTTERVSVGSVGEQSNNESYPSSISSDGRYVAFTSYSNNLIPNDTNGNVGDVFVYDRQTDIIEIVSISNAGIQGNQSSVTPSLSSDGRYIAFRSQANNLVTGDTNNAQDIFVYDRNTDSIERVSVSNAGIQGNLDSSNSAISANGRYVSFMADASNLVTGDTNSSRDIFVYDRQTDLIKRISVTNGGVQGNADSLKPSISSDGRYVTFASDASNLVTADTNSSRDVFVYDRNLSTIKRISLTHDSAQSDGSSSSPSISANGLLVVFESDATNLVLGDTNNQTDIFTQVSKRVITQKPLQLEHWNPVVSPSPDPIIEKKEEINLEKTQK